MNDASDFDHIYATVQGVAMVSRANQPENVVPTLGIVVDPGDLTLPDRGDLTLPDRFTNLFPRIDGVFEGGGALGAAFSGALRLLEDNFIWFGRVAGTSAGAITAALVAAGYSAREIDWLMSAHGNPGPRPASLAAELEPIEFLQFLDPLADVSTISEDAMRRSFLHRVLRGEIINQIREATLDAVPGRADLIELIINALAASFPPFGIALQVEGARDLAQQVLNGVLGFFPAEPRLGDFPDFFDTSALREDFADSVWRFIAGLPLTGFFLRQSTQLLHEGSLFLGETFLQTMDRLLRASKSKRQNGGAVRFQDLQIPLSVAAADLRTRQLVTYSSGTHPDMPVAEAVRQSMSIPVAFEPREGYIVDGGVYSNFPAWMLSNSADYLWPEGTADPIRPKIGFALEDGHKTPSEWQLSPPKFQARGNPPAVELHDVLVATLQAAIDAHQVGFPDFDVPDLLDTAPMKLFEIAFGMSAARNSNQEVTRQTIARAVFPEGSYYDVPIPLLGFHWLDFALNLQKRDLDSIRQRGWRAALESLTSKNGDTQPLLVGKQGQNPYATSTSLEHEAPLGMYIEDRLLNLERQVSKLLTLEERIDVLIQRLGELGPTITVPAGSAATPGPGATIPAEDDLTFVGGFQ
jgi:predicted acylesterase/phospholipase RssA